MKASSTDGATRYLASIGALIMILANAFDAFVQQTLSIGQQTQAHVMIDSNLTAGNILLRTISYFHGW